MNRRMAIADREEVYNAPIIPWNNGTYTPLANSMVMDLIDTKINNLGLVVKDEHYKVTRTSDGLIKGVIGSYDISTPDGDYGQRVMFRNSYDKSMSFAFVCGMVVWICSNGCISGDYQYRRIHRGAFLEGTSTTEKEVIASVEGGFTVLQNSFEHTSEQLNELKHFEVSPEEVFKILGTLFFTKQVINITQMSIIKRELASSQNFRHLGDLKFTAYDLYNHITESLKTSHPTTYVNDHVVTHSLFEETFNL